MRRPGIGPSSPDLDPVAVDCFGDCFCSREGVTWSKAMARRDDELLRVRRSLAVSVVAQAFFCDDGVSAALTTGAVLYEERRDSVSESAPEGDRAV
jgi:hypothetical protein